MSDVGVDVFVRCKNEMPYADRVFRVLRHPALRVVVFDNGSTDGSREAAIDAGFDIVDVDPAGYMPGRVLNRAMHEAKTDVVCFVNADAIPESVDDVFRLADACRNGAAAAYGRQYPRPDARATTREDYERVFPDTADGPGFRHFFSMAASAIRTDVWAVVPFDEKLRYSEDVDWTLRLRGIGLDVAYVPSARFEHSHDYDRKGIWRRMVGEGVADRFIYRLGPPNPVHQFALPLAAQWRRDLRARVASPSSAFERSVAQGGRLYGRWTGWTSPPWGIREEPLEQAQFFTHGREPAAEAMVARVLAISADVIGAGLGSDLQALLLIGGYAGGEGAIDWKDGEPHIHNDVDLVAVVPSVRKARALRGRCLQLSEQTSEKAGACVDVFPIARAELARTNGKLLWLDAAVRGVKLVTGDEEVLRPLEKLGARTVASGELGRLLMNRATGLAISRLSFAEGQDESSRAARHVAKAWMAIGDALLLSMDRYARTGKSRLENLQGLATVGASWVGEVAEGYQMGLEFRRNPAEQRIDRDTLQAAAAKMWPCFAAVEAHRLGRPVWTHPEDYANERLPRFPELVDVSTAGRLLAGPKAALAGRISWQKSFRHPRDVLARTSAMLAFASDEQAARSLSAKWLGLRNGDPHHLQNSLETLREIAA